MGRFEITYMLQNLQCSSTARLMAPVCRCALSSLAVTSGHNAFGHTRKDIATCVAEREGSHADSTQASGVRCPAFETPFSWSFVFTLSPNVRRSNILIRIFQLVSVVDEESQGPCQVGLPQASCYADSSTLAFAISKLSLFAQDCHVKRLVSFGIHRLPAWHS